MSSVVYLPASGPCILAFSTVGSPGTVFYGYQATGTTDLTLVPSLEGATPFAVSRNPSGSYQTQYLEPQNGICIGSLQSGDYLKNESDVLGFEEPKAGDSPFQDSDGSTYPFVFHLYLPPNSQLPVPGSEVPDLFQALCPVSIDQPYVLATNSSNSGGPVFQMGSDSDIVPYPIDDSFDWDNAVTVALLPASPIYMLCSATYDFGYQSAVPVFYPNNGIPWTCMTQPGGGSTCISGAYQVVMASQVGACQGYTQPSGSALDFKDPLGKTHRASRLGAAQESDRAALLALLVTGLAGVGLAVAAAVLLTRKPKVKN